MKCRSGEEEKIVKNDENFFFASIERKSWRVSRRESEKEKWSIIKCH